MPKKGDNYGDIISTESKNHLGNCDVVIGSSVHRGVFYSDHVAIGDDRGITGYMHRLTLRSGDFSAVKQGNGVRVVPDFAQDSGGDYIVSDRRFSGASTVLLLSRA